MGNRWSHRAGLLTAAMVLGLAGCAPAPSRGLPSPDVPVVMVVTIIAESLTFAPPRVPLPSDQELRFVLANQDEGIPHGMAIMGGPAFGREVIASDVAVGPEGAELSLPTGLIAGAYRLICPVHPATMMVELTIEP